MVLLPDTCLADGNEGELEVLLSLLLGLNTPQARHLQDSFAMQSTLLLLLRDLLLEGGTQPPDNLLHLIARMQKKHQRRLRRRQRAASKEQLDDSVAPLHLPPCVALQPCPGPDEPQSQPPPSRYFSPVLGGPATGAADPILDSLRTSEEERDDPRDGPAGSRPA